MNDPQNTYLISEAIKKLKAYCAYQERCQKEVRTKLKEFNISSENSDAIINHLIDRDYLDDKRFAKAYTRGKFNIKKWGRIRIVSELKKRSISSFNIKTALEEIDDESYLETLDYLVKVRLEQIGNKNKLEIRRKLANYLLYRGWESWLVYDKIAEVLN